MNQHETPRGSQSETRRPESFGETTEEAAESRDQRRSAPALEGVRADQRGGHEGLGALPEPAS